MKFGPNSVDALVGHRLRGVTRLAWHQPGQPVLANVGPVQLTFDGGPGLLLAGRSDWTIGVSVTADGDEWLAAYDYELDDGRWVNRVALAEEPFALAIGRRLVDWSPLLNEGGELVGVSLDFDGQALTLRNWEGEVTT